jgi:hypothetical protein
MNKPYYFDAIDISKFNIFSIVIALGGTMFVSKCIKVSDLVVCMASVMSFFIGNLFIIYGNSAFYIYMSRLKFLYDIFYNKIMVKFYKKN